MLAWSAARLHWTCMVRALGEIIGMLEAQMYQDAGQEKHMHIEAYLYQDTLGAVTIVYRDTDVGGDACMSVEAHAAGHILLR